MAVTAAAAQWARWPANSQSRAGSSTASTAMRHQSQLGSDSHQEPPTCASPRTNLLTNWQRQQRTRSLCRQRHGRSGRGLRSTSTRVRQSGLAPGPEGDIARRPPENHLCWDQRPKTPGVVSRSGFYRAAGGLGPAAGGGLCSRRPGMPLSNDLLRNHFSSSQFGTIWRATAWNSARAPGRSPVVRPFTTKPRAVQTTACAIAWAASRSRPSRSPSLVNSVVQLFSEARNSR